MKKANQLLIILSIVGLAACFNKVDPAVETFYLKSKHSDSVRSEAFSKFYEHYSNSDNTKEYFEVISKGDYIINYYATGKLMAICYDPGSGWGGQYNNVDEAALRSLANLRIKLDKLQSYVIKDSLIDNNEPFIEVKTNGHPN
ncbi:hypothetical protein [Dyadobacter sp. CY343]|uniref:hypothetical protein n=1 Tax=Dyadobacter sp. CY343 TaxID=2907299 RepID=UPI001F42F334|nr:hypothetical protein [Dyadobacter sp. CY343]MCE7058731.1 hypothetical protein [Dyadobacter sp. CY343]